MTWREDHRLKSVDELLTTILNVNKTTHCVLTTDAAGTAGICKSQTPELSKQTLTKGCESHNNKRLRKEL